MPSDKFTVGVVGAGAVGSIVASCLAEAGAEIVVADIPIRNAQLNENGIRVSWNDRQLNHKVITVDSIKDLKSHEPDLIYISTKACILERLMPEVAEAAGDSATVMSVQNGIGTEDEISKSVDPDRVARMVVNFAGRIDENGDVFVNWFNPPNYFGPQVDGDKPSVAKFVELLNSVGMESELVDTNAIKKKAYFKTILNSALMPVCAVMDMTMSQAMNGPLTRKLACDCLREGIEVGKKLGFDYGEGIEKVCEGYLEKGGDHHPSMSVDLQNKRPTEIEFINGKILELGQGFDVSLETNRILVSLLVTMELENGTRKPENIPGYLL